MAKIFKTTFKVRRGLKEVWDAYEEKVILAEGEPGYELDTHRLKIGDGIHTWKELPYVGNGSTSVPEMGDYITRADLEDLVKNLIKSSDEVNKVKILEDGTMEVNALNVTKLTQNDEDVLILDGSI